MIQNIGAFAPISDKWNLSRSTSAEYKPVAVHKVDSFSSSSQKENKSSEYKFLTPILALSGSFVAGVLGHKFIHHRNFSMIKDGIKETVFAVAVKDFEKTSLYLKFINSRKSFVDFIKNSKDSPSEMKEFLFGVTSHPEISQKFIADITSNTRKSRSITNDLVQKVGGQKNFIDWYFHPKGYQASYEKFAENAFNSAKTPDELFQLSPNWQYYKIVEKFGTNFTAGVLPKEIGGVEQYRDIVSKIMHREELPQGVSIVNELKPGLSGKSAVAIKIDDKKYVLKFHIDPVEFSPELKRSNLDLLENKSTSWLGDYYFERIKENELMKSDSVFLNAQIDLYLKHHNSQNVANIHFFDSKTKSSLYELAEGDTLSQQDTILSLNQKISDSTDLGIIYNDVQPSNFMVKNGIIKNIDSGDSSYVDILRPGCSYYHFNSPNLCGMSMPSCLAGLNLDNLKIS